MQGGWSGREWPISGGVEAGKDAGLSHFELVGKDVMIKKRQKDDMAFENCRNEVF